jgi:DNA polymerase-3 subunit gamma/tau
MAYQVLARKWRPASFDTLVGQEHVAQALRHALDTERLHHAYLFTGTRGVGKTTIARILARCLNCEQGVSATPCGECATCMEISEGRSVDLMEVDAASRTKVEDTRELLENVQYAPTRSRYKVYLIAEVHMLSGHSFNALLKTLEEPPEHVKFLLATTDPQKLPATVLSRCLQFNLKNLSAERIAGHLREVLAAEGVSAEEGSLWLLGRAAQGSMRDALSLTDQAIAFGSGELREADVATMLGSVDRVHVFSLLDAVLAEDGGALLDCCAAMGEQRVDFSDAVEELCSVLHRIAVAQAVPSAVNREFGDAERVVELAARMGAEDTQLFYEFAAAGRQRIAGAPDPRAAFEMLALRLLAFRPVAVLDPMLEASAIGPSADDAGEVGDGAKKPEPPSAATGGAALPPVAEPPAPPAPAAEPVAPQPKSAAAPEPMPAPERASAAQPAPEPAGGTTEAPAAIEVPPSAPAENSGADLPWHEILEQLGLSGSAYNIASHCALDARGEECWEFTLEEGSATLFKERRRAAIERAMAAHVGRAIAVRIAPGVVASETPAQRRARLDAERLAEAEAAIAADPRVQRLLEDFEGELVAGSVRVGAAGDEAG